MRRVAAAVQAIAAGHASKLVVSRACSTRAPRAFSPAATLARLIEAQPGACAFAVSPGGAAGTFLGASPEPLVRARGGAVETVALAGTASRPADLEAARAAEAALLGCPKNAREHALVVEAVRRDLAGACSSVEVLPTHVRRLPGLLHLETPVRGRLQPGGSLLHAAAALHPTPALAGSPRTAAVRWLRAHEGLDRGWFGGALGWLGAPGEGALTVAIRCALLRGREAWLYAGAGVVEGSDPAQEWAETELKLATVRASLAVEADA